MRTAHNLTKEQRKQVLELGFPMSEESMTWMDWRKHTTCNKWCQIEFLGHFVYHNPEFERDNSGGKDE